MDDEVGTSIRKARERRGWSQEFLAAKVGATQSTIDRIENGQTRRSRVLPEIFAALDMEVSGVPKTAQPEVPNSNFVKVSYVLPKELVARIEEYKNNIGIPSDDEAVRRLIDDTLKHKDTAVSITNRLITKFKSVRSLREAAGYVLANHPLVGAIIFESGSLTFNLTDGYRVTIENVAFSAVAAIYKPDGHLFTFHKDVAPDWITSGSVVEEWQDSDAFPF